MLVKLRRCNIMVLFTHCYHDHLPSLVTVKDKSCSWVRLGCASTSQVYLG